MKNKPELTMPQAIKIWKDLFINPCKEPLKIKYEFNGIKINNKPIVKAEPIVVHYDSKKSSQIELINYDEILKMVYENSPNIYNDEQNGRTITITFKGVDEDE